MRTRPLFFASFLLLVTCTADQPDVPDAAPGPTYEDIVLAGYDDAARAFESDNGLPDGWAEWMIARKERFAGAYVRARTDRRIRIEVRYEASIAYDPPWADEDEHMAALERVAELAYPGWDFSFAFDDPAAEFHAVLGHSGVSYADGDTVYLVWEGIFLHEFGHLLGIGHHYCDCCGEDRCQDRYPPGEGACIMARTSATWGPAEQFALGLGQQRADAAVLEVITDLNGRYPPSWRLRGDRDPDPLTFGLR